MSFFFKNKICLEPVASEENIEKHRNFLKNRIEEARTKVDVRIDVLEQRLKMFTRSRINFYIPNFYFKSKTTSRELDYYFRFVSNLNKSMSVVTINNDQKFYIPIDCINIAEKKKKSLLDKFSNISAIIH